MGAKKVLRIDRNTTEKDNGIEVGAELHNITARKRRIKKAVTFSRTRT